MWWRSSRCPSLGCSALDVELEWNGEDANDLRGIVLPHLGSDLPLIFQGSESPNLVLVINDTKLLMLLYQVV
jgi:hypothetical protein